MSDNLRCLERTQLGIGARKEGKVRDMYISDVTDQVVMVTTDRISAFDRNLGTIPYKGALLTAVSKYFLDNTRHIIDNHMLSNPHPNVLVCRKAEP